MFRSMYGNSDIFASMDGLRKLTSSDEKETFSPFHDYLGLINLIRTTGITTSLDSPSSETSSIASFDYPSSPLYHRTRMDSLDSDSISDSSSIGSRESGDVMYDSWTSDSLSTAFAPQPSELPTITQQQQTYAKTLETIMSHQTALNRLNAATAVKDSKNVKTAATAANKATVCVFCRNNGESREFYSSHTLKDNSGNTTCPILRAYTCPLCKANGDQAHTIKYCPKYTPKLKADKFLGLGLTL